MRIYCPLSMIRTNDFTRDALAHILSTHRMGVQIQMGKQCDTTP